MINWRIPALMIVFTWANLAHSMVSPKIQLSSGSLLIADITPKAQSIQQTSIQQGIRLRSPKSRQTFIWLQEQKAAVNSVLSSSGSIANFSAAPLDVSVGYRPQTISATTHELMLIQRYKLPIAWMQYPPSCSSRLAGWKESNILYTGAITYA